MQKTSSRMGTLPRALRIVLAALIAMTLIPIGALMAPAKAYAATSPPSTLTGRFTLSLGFSTSPSYQGDFPGTVTLNGGYTLASFGNNSGGNNGRASCISPGAANWGDPANLNNRSGTVNATWYSDDPASGLSWYRMTVTPDLQPAVGAAGVQYLGNTWLAIRWDFEGWIKLVKSSSAPAISSNNPDYSLAGAVYEIHRSSDGAVVATLTTNASGEATSAALEAGSYYLTEKTAPKGFAVDVTSHNVTVVAGETTTVSVKDAPLGWIEIIKSSANPDVTNGNECYSLAGAEYGVYASSADAAKDTKRVTVRTTDAEGYAKSPKMRELASYYV
ncbi:MAG: prealbumin-like fold domain-containing protein, partial [Coriobacteriales bacterium]|nr:prealbumin-like fold domain-containing protein [Coriobacteriales bacterium]